MFRQGKLKALFYVDSVGKRLFSFVNVCSRLKTHITYTIWDKEIKWSIEGLTSNFFTRSVSNDYIPTISGIQRIMEYLLGFKEREAF